VWILALAKVRTGGGKPMLESDHGMVDPPQFWAKIRRLSEIIAYA
jgi:hypothetical protein